MTGKPAFLALSLLALPSSAVASGPGLVGKYAFNWFKEPGRQRCVRIDQILDAVLRSGRFRCGTTFRTNTSSGAPALTCASRDGRTEYLVFTSKALCEKERETQASNE